VQLHSLFLLSFKINKNKEDMKNLASFEEFCKMGVSPLVKKHYSGATDKAEDLSDPKDSEVKGKGDTEHTEKAKSDDLSDPKIAQKSKI